MSLAYNKVCSCCLCRFFCELNHLLSIDDLKLYAPLIEEPRDLLKLVKGFSEDVKMELRLLGSGLNSKNTVRVINTFAILVMGYSFDIVGWSKTDADALQRKIRVLMTKYKKHHPKFSADRTMLPRHMGGRGLMDIDN